MIAMLKEHKIINEDIPINEFLEIQIVERIVDLDTVGEYIEFEDIKDEYKNE